ncbi:hypothetical protein BDV96DRAFT_482839 [Lophiotrema nucula]|uniref:Uncharacterized protein n=1 Tax=Lophiotrema nucula TaxID=690887 RepID=A0A6A5ZV28_9PLEO|nr:hypothetical protein BDV96DRAFT_482839 [Lophiotrema nucula]
MISAREDTAMSDFTQSHLRHHEYSYRLPTPPRIVVPPPTLTTDMPELAVGNGTNTPGEDIDMSFLKEAKLENILQKNTLLEWAYERRRQAQMILPWLYLGPLTAAKDREFIAREGITMILAIRSRENSMNGILHAGLEFCQEIATVEAPDFFTLIGQFSRTIQMINRHISKVRQLTASTGNPQLGKVLIFCESGNEKSAAVAAAYLMETLDDFNYVKAMQVCQAQRFCVNFDDTIKNILRSHWDIIQARRAVSGSRTDLIQSATLQEVAQQRRNHSGPTMSKPKRNIDDTLDDEDVDMDGGLDPSDVLRFENRANTPFQDS